eukprot:TRINITY_DN743_c0_g1_i5.p1 TRINITY_DN743_c0_g1~~TRINITY_DN743_c0_g1_i5.p1  ORF type:complete len:213 (+),score=59.97 TRINITY_DN743_c0_g1_i5:483-1121(+)
MLLPGTEGWASGKDLAQVSWSLVNDSLRTTLCCRFPPTVIATAAIFLAARKVNVKLPDEEWWCLFDTETVDLVEAAKGLAAAQKIKKPVYKKLCNELPFPSGFYGTFDKAKIEAAIESAKSRRSSSSSSSRSSSSSSSRKRRRRRDEKERDRDRRKDKRDRDRRKDKDRRDKDRRDSRRDRDRDSRKARDRDRDRSRRYRDLSRERDRRERR